MEKTYRTFTGILIARTALTVILNSSKISGHMQSKPSPKNLTQKLQQVWVFISLTTVQSAQVLLRCNWLVCSCQKSLHRAITSNSSLAAKGKHAVTWLSGCSENRDIVYKRQDWSALVGCLFLWVIKKFSFLTIFKFWRRWFPGDLIWDTLPDLWLPQTLGLI